MASDAAMRGVLLEEAALTLEELARVCAVEPDWVLQHVQAGVLLADAGQVREGWRFTSVDLVRARQLLEVEQVFDANEDVAALVVDLSEEVRRLKARLRVAGIAS
ncbi:MerR family transcriptional regulator [Massilia sp. erpn]|uniref:MerR family transcriptional regulator n=1 Tax=Massilia sp. erpn TaxID=2738142 RepID=UPI0021039359|nr:MerR family transcriptional regulator [Massilia sp. erpn]UTY55929.1 MerR family transcriptional regulator [Massilia sp. erpn]